MMGVRTGNPTWVDSATVAEAEANPSRKITAAKLNAIEDAIDALALTPGPQGDPGDDGASAYEVAVAEGFVGNEAAWLASLVGPKGDKGDKGDSGDPGPKGDKGDKGDTGDTGADSTVPGPKGDKGDKGDPGDEGPPGPSAVSTDAGNLLTLGTDDLVMLDPDDLPAGGGGGASTLDDLTDVDTTGATTGDTLTYNGTTWIADAPSAGTVTSTSISDSTATGRAVLTAADAAAARGAIGAGTSSFDGAYSSLSGRPTLGTAAAANTGDFAPALGADDNYVTDAEKAELHGHSNKAALDLVSGTNTGDQDLSGLATTTALTAGLAGKADADHDHAISEVTGLQTALDGKQAAGSYAAASHTHAASQISDSTATGRSVLTAADAAAARTAIGAGTSNLAIGTTGSTAAAGNRAASTSAIGMVELATTAEATTGTDTSRAVTPAGVKAVVDALTIPDSPDDIGAAPATQAINARTAAYTLVASDAGKLVTMTSSTARTLTVPANVFTAGQRVDLADRGSARMTVVAGGGMTVNPPPGGSLVMEGRYAYASLVFISATEADLVGLVAAS